MMISVSLSFYMSIIIRPPGKIHQTLLLYTSEHE